MPEPELNSASGDPFATPIVTSSKVKSVSSPSFQVIFSRCHWVVSVNGTLNWAEYSPPFHSTPLSVLSYKYRRYSPSLPPHTSAIYQMQPPLAESAWNSSSTVPSSPIETSERTCIGTPPNSVGPTCSTTGDCNPV